MSSIARTIALRAVLEIQPSKLQIKKVKMKTIGQVDWSRKQEGSFGLIAVHVEDYLTIPCLMK